MPAVNGVSNGVARPKKPSTNGASAVPQHIPSPYEVMASRIANRVAEMAENITFVERERPSQQPASPAPKAKKPPRKLEMRLGQNNGSSPTNITFSAPFLDNTLAKMLSLQDRMLKVGQDLAASEDVEESVKQEQFKQSAELSRIIALICAEKARQGS
ncbi:hypothetical protein BU16DRAFT_527361 [Lophium mytilinum]|uniref:Uncharacterized protein n=1 Tax=Lophium mytilinum TaxID=390894 RepID=A0A6A6QTX6_9PEZI|nr:hypothetical protein BU16DRAFT_527361 [Lophium mytilinum]